MDQQVGVDPSDTYHPLTHTGEHDDAQMLWCGGISSNSTCKQQ